MHFVKVLREQIHLSFLQHHRSRFRKHSDHTEN